MDCLNTKTVSERTAMVHSVSNLFFGQRLAHLAHFRPWNPLYRIAGRSYEGAFLNGKRLDGEGRMTYPDGHVYIGSFEEELRHGAGTIWYANKDGALPNVHVLSSGTHKHEQPSASVLYQVALILEGVVEELNVRFITPFPRTIDPDFGLILRLNLPQSRVEQTEEQKFLTFAGSDKKDRKLIRSCKAPPQSPDPEGQAEAEAKARENGQGASSFPADSPRHPAGTSVSKAAMELANEKPTSMIEEDCFEGMWVEDQRTTGRLAAEFPEVGYEVEPCSLGLRKSPKQQKQQQEARLKARAGGLGSGLQTVLETRASQGSVRRPL